MELSNKEPTAVYYVTGWIRVNQQRKEESCILAELRWVSLMNIVTAN